MLTFKNILCPTDFSEPSYEGLKYAIELAARFGAELSVVHVLPVVPPLPPDPNYVFEVPEYERALHLEAEGKLRALTEEMVPKEIRVRTLIGHGNAGNEIVRIAKDEGADLIVIATHGLTGWRHLVFGSVAERAVRAAACPVLTVRAPRQ
jgi:nucleotide-binding universal stress UspA family protein